MDYINSKFIVFITPKLITKEMEFSGLATIYELY